MGGGIDQSISPGIGGFLAFFLLAVALWLLMRSMSGRLRKVRFDEEAEDERRAAEAGDDVVTRPSRRRIFLPVQDDADGVPSGGAADAATPAPTTPAPKVDPAPGSDPDPRA